MDQSKSNESLSRLERLLDADDLAQVLCLTVAAVRVRLYRSPDSLPPFLRIGRLIRWSPAVVTHWLQAQTALTDRSPPVAVAASPPAPLPQPNRRPRARESRELARQRVRSARSADLDNDRTKS